MSGIGNIFSGMRTASSGLSAERTRIDVIANNIANSQVTRTPGGGAFRRKIVSFKPLPQKVVNGRLQGGGVYVSSITPDYVTQMELLNEPEHPDANEEGIVEYPNVNSIREMADMMTAIRAYEANLKAQEVFMRMAQRSLELLR